MTNNRIRVKWVLTGEEQELALQDAEHYVRIGQAVRVIETTAQKRKQKKVHTTKDILHNR